NLCSQSRIGQAYLRLTSERPCDSLGSELVLIAAKKLAGAMDLPGRSAPGGRISGLVRGTSGHIILAVWTVNGHATRPWSTGRKANGPVPRPVLAGPSWTGSKPCDLRWAS